MTSSTPVVEDGVGTPVGSADELWRAATAELAPDKFLGRVTANARATVATVTLVGTALTGFGLVSAQTMLGEEPARSLALAATATALAAVLLALVFHAQRLDDVNLEDLADVERWYLRQFRRARLAVVASWLLVLSVLLATAAGLLTLSANDEDVAASLRAARGDGSSTVDAEVTVGGLRPGTVLVVTVTALARTGCGQVVLWEAAGRAGRTGQVTIQGTGTAALCHRSFRLRLHDDAGLRSSLTVP